MDESFAKLTLKEKLNFSDEDLEKRAHHQAQWFVGFLFRF